MIGQRHVLHCVTDRRRGGLTVSELVTHAQRAAAAGADIIQVRERDLPDRELVALVREIVAIVSGTTAKVLVNDRADVALAAGAAGVHLRADSPAAARVRVIVPAQFIIGRSVHTAADIEVASREGGYDYLLFGTVFPSAGKAADHPTAGLEGLRDACARTTIPVVAIGGMSPARLPPLLDAGAAGLAAVGWFM